MWCLPTNTTLQTLHVVPQRVQIPRHSSQQLCNRLLLLRPTGHRSATSMTAMGTARSTPRAGTGTSTMPTTVPCSGTASSPSAVGATASAGSSHY